MTDKCTHLVIDMLNDFIYGSMACLNAENALMHSIAYINAHIGDEVCFACDAHPKNHCSFIGFGGQWPEHCVVNTRGQEIHEAYYTKTAVPSLRPSLSRIFNKGCNPEQEQYSAFDATNADGVFLHDVLTRHVVVSGIATEFCVLETVTDLLKAGFAVRVLEKGLAYVDFEGHKAALEKMRERGAELI